MLNESVPDVRTRQQAPTVTQPPEAYARELMDQRLTADPVFAAICEALNTVDCQEHEISLVPIRQRALKDAVRIMGLAKLAVRSLDPAIISDAIDEVAHVICAGADGQYAPLEHQDPRMQAMYRRWAVIAFNAARFVLEGSVR